MSNDIYSEKMVPLDLEESMDGVQEQSVIDTVNHNGVFLVERRKGDRRKKKKRVRYERRRNKDQRQYHTKRISESI